MTAIFLLVDTLLSIAFWVILIQVIMSWLIMFNVINLYQPLVRQIWDGLNRLTEPVYRPIRNVLPNLGGLDLAPMIVIIGIFFLQNLWRYDIGPAMVS
ncbi:MAG: YggT family protein [Pseudomonadota bacterium]